MKRARNDGFSLIELMVVMVIIGVAYSAVRFLSPNPSPEDEALKHANALQFWFEKQMDHALISGNEIGFYITEQQWYAMRWRKGEEINAEPNIVWEVDDSVNAFSLTEAMRFEIVIDDLGNRWLELQNTLPDDDFLQPQIILLPSEEYFPSFVASVLPRNNFEGSYKISVIGNGYNRLVVQHEQ